MWANPKRFLPSSIEITARRITRQPVPSESHPIQFNTFIKGDFGLGLYIHPKIPIK
jgi:hypothetical protein